MPFGARNEPQPVEAIFSGECRTFEETPGTSERLIGQRLDYQVDARYQQCLGGQSTGASIESSDLLSTKRIVACEFPVRCGSVGSYLQFLPLSYRRISSPARAEIQELLDFSPPGAKGSFSGSAYELVGCPDLPHRVSGGGNEEAKNGI